MNASVSKMIDGKKASKKFKDVLRVYVSTGSEGYVFTDFKETLNGAKMDNLSITNVSDPITCDTVTPFGTGSALIAKVEYRNDNNIIICVSKDAMLVSMSTDDEWCDISIEGGKIVVKDDMKNSHEEDF